MTYAFVGDSHMQALGPLLKRLLPNVTYHAKPGWSVKKWAQQPPQISADVTVFVLGGNDRERDPSKYEADVRNLLQSASGKVLWVGPSYAKGEIGTWHARTRELQRVLFSKLGIRWIDSYPWTKENLRSDGVHFTSAGYQTWAQELAREITAQRQLGYWWVLPLSGALALAVALRARARARA